MKLLPTESEMSWLKDNQPFLKFESYQISGLFRLSKSFNKVALSKKYLIYIVLDVKQYDQIPKVYIDKNQLDLLLSEYSIKKEDIHINSDNSLCLCIPELNCLYLRNGYNLIDFIEKLLTPFLYWITYFMEYKKKPWDDYSHGDLGYVEAVKDNVLEKSVLSNIQNDIEKSYYKKLRQKRGYK